jgi:hypothetical protein
MNRILPLLALLAALFVSGCTTFDREWRLWGAATPGTMRSHTKKPEPPPTAQSPFDGRWKGRWTSEKHTKMFSKEPASGEVAAVISRIDPYRYRANFRAHWAGFRGDYLTELYGRERRGRFEMRGAFPLSRIYGGDYHYTGTITPKEFRMRYESAYDSGTVIMSRVP